MKLISALLLCSLVSPAATFLRLACGGPGGVDPAGNTWSADSGSAGAAWVNSPPAGLVAPYLNLRYATSLLYTIPVPAGDYILTLKFIEPNKTGAGQRLFSASVNGARVVAGLDLFAVAGLLKPYDLSFPVTSTGQLQILFTATVGNAVISGIQLDPIPPPPPPPPAPLLPAAVSALDGAGDACQPVLQPFSSRLQAGGQLCSVPSRGPVAQGAGYTDFTFGGHSVAQTPPGPAWVHGYGLPSPLSASNRYLIVADQQGRKFALDRSQGFRPALVPGGNMGLMWHPSDDDVFYFLNDKQILAHHMAANVDTVALDVSATLQHIENGGSVHNSADGWTTFFSTADHTVCAADLLAGKSYCADYLAPEVVARGVGFNFIDFTVTSNIDVKTNKRYAVLIASPALAVWSVNVAAGRLDFEYRGPEAPTDLGFNNAAGNHDDRCDAGENCMGAPHGDLTEIGGSSYFVTVADTGSTPCNRMLAAFPIAAGLRMYRDMVPIAVLNYCSSQFEWTDFDIGCSPVTGACAVSTYSNRENPAAGPFDGLVMVMRDFGHLVKLGYHRSARKGSDTYWFQPRGAISRDGRYIVYDSNLGQPDFSDGTSHEQVFLMRTTLGGPVDDVPAVTPALAALDVCTGSGPGWDCAGLYRATVQLGDGSALPIIGPSFHPVAAAGAVWSAVR